MSSGALPQDVRRFITSHVATVEQLEILCLVSREPGRLWSVSEVFRQIQSSERSVAQCLELFKSKGLLVPEKEGYRFSPVSRDVSETVARLCTTYHERRVSIVELIYQRPSDPLQDFADAFKLRKNP